MVDEGKENHPAKKPDLGCLLHHRLGQETLAPRLARIIIDTVHERLRDPADTAP